jgi:hypothetical protein
MYSSTRNQKEMATAVLGKYGYYGNFRGLKATTLEGVIEEVAATVFTAVEHKYPDLKDCENASHTVKEVLVSLGYVNAKVIGVSVVAGTIRDPGRLICGRPYEYKFRSRHYVALVDGYLIDATLGQFRSDTVPAPDYLIMSDATPHLKLNRRAVASGGKSEITWTADEATDFAIAYLPDGVEYSL